MFLRPLESNLQASVREGAVITTTAPCYSPPSVILLLLLNGSLGLGALQKRPVLRDVAAYKVSKLSGREIYTPQNRRNISVVARTLQKAYLSNKSCQSSFKGEAQSALPDVAGNRDASHVSTASQSILRMFRFDSHKQPNDLFGLPAVRRSQSLSVAAERSAPLVSYAQEGLDTLNGKKMAARAGWRDKDSIRHSLQLHSLAHPSLRSYQLCGMDAVSRTNSLRHWDSNVSSVLRPNHPSAKEALQESECHEVEHLYGRSENKFLSIGSTSAYYGCRIIPIYDEKQSRFRALRNQEEARWQEEKKHEQLSIQQLAIASFTRPLKYERAPHSGLHIGSEAPSRGSRLSVSNHGNSDNNADHISPASWYPRNCPNDTHFKGYGLNLPSLKMPQAVPRGGTRSNIEADHADVPSYNLYHDEATWRHFDHINRGQQHRFNSNLC